MRTRRLLAVALMIAMLLLPLQAASGEDESPELFAAVEDAAEPAVGGESVAVGDESSEAPSGGDEAELDAESWEDALPGDPAEESVEIEDADLLEVLEDIEAPDAFEYPAEDLEAIEGIRVYSEGDTYDIPEGGKLQLYADPILAEGVEEAHVYSFVWESMDEAVAGVSSTGVVTAYATDAIRSVVIRAVAYEDTEDGKVERRAGEQTVWVIPLADEILVTDAEDAPVGEAFAFGNNAALNYACTPADAAQAVSVEVGDASILTAEVNEAEQKVFLTANQTGVTTLTLTSADGSAVATIRVTASKDGESTDLKINVDKTQYVALNKTISLGATVTPAGAGTLSYKTKDKKTATVTGKGSVKGVKAGYTTITITCKDASGATVATETVKVYVNPKPITKVAVASKTGSKVVYIGETLQLTATVTPSTTNTRKAVKWTSSDEGVATVEGDGIVTGVAAGSVKITCAATDGNKKSASITLYVGNKPDNIKIECYDVVGVGKSITLKATNEGEDVQSDGFSYTSSNKNYATVSSKGVVKGVKKGTVTVTVKDKPSGKSAKKEITILPAIKTVTLDRQALSFDWDAIESSGQEAPKETLRVETIAPGTANQDVKAFTWKSSNEAVATVEVDPETGIATVTPVGGGTATVTATATDGSKVSGKCTVTVARAATSLKVIDPITGEAGSDIAIDVGVGKTVSLKTVFEPADAADKSVTWNIKKADKAYATVSSKGVVKGVKRGKTVIITAKSEKYNLAATVRVTVKALTTKLTLKSSPAPAFLKPVAEGEASDQSLTLTAALSSGASAKLKWTASPAGMVELAPSGKTCVVTAVPGGPAGKVTVKAAVTDGSKLSKTITVYVGYKVTGIALTPASPDGKTLYVLKGKTAPAGALAAALAGEDGQAPTVKSLTWSVGNKAYATVNGSGRVKGVKAGKTYVMVTAKDGTKVTSNKVTVRVIDKASSKVTINNDGPDFLYAGGSGKLTATVTNAGYKGKIGVVWASSDDDVVEVKPDGRVEAKAVGTATITATAADGSGKKATKAIEVGVAADSVEVFGLHAVAAGASTQLSATVYDAEGNVIENSPVAWSLKEENGAASVDADGVVKGLNAGQVTVVATATATAKDPLPTAEFVVEVTGEAASMDICLAGEPVTDTTIHLFRGDSIQLGVRVEPDSNNASAAWSGLTARTKGKDASGIASVDADGIVTAVKAGTAHIRATLADGSNKEAWVTVEVNDPVERITVSMKNAGWTVHSDEALQLKATALPASARQDVDWSSSDESVATIDANGAVTLHAYGAEDITFTATAKDGSGVTGEIAISFSTGFEWSVGDEGATVTRYTGSDAVVTIPEYVNGVKVTEIGDEAFMGNEAITAVEIPNRVSRIGARAFKDCTGLSSMTPYGDID